MTVAHLLVEPNWDLDVPREAGREGADGKGDKICSDAKYRKKTSDPAFVSIAWGICIKLQGFVNVDVKNVGRENLSGREITKKKRDNYVKSHRRGRARKRRGTEKRKRLVEMGSHPHIKSTEMPLNTQQTHTRREKRQTSTDKLLATTLPPDGPTS